MFTRSDLSALMSAAPPLGVSIFLPTHIRGSEIRQDPIRLKNLAAEAVDKLVATGMGEADAEAFVEPATALVSRRLGGPGGVRRRGGTRRCTRRPLRVSSSARALLRV